MLPVHHVYIDQMSQTLEQRIREHIKALKDFDVDVSELTKLVLTKKHLVDWTSAKVIEVQNKQSQRRLLKSWHIGKEHKSYEQRRRSAVNTVPEFN